MAKLRIMPHSRLQEWVAEEKGYFKDEGLDYEFITPGTGDRFRNPSIETTDSAPVAVKDGAFEKILPKDQIELQFVGGPFPFFGKPRTRGCET